MNQRTAAEQALHDEAIEVCERITRDQASLIEILQQIDRVKLYKKFQRSSLFQYAVHELKLSESVAYCFINVARKAREISSLNEAIRNRSLSVSKAGRIVSALTQENSGGLVEFAMAHSCEKIDREVAKLNPKSGSGDKVKFLSEDLVQVTVTISKAAFANLKRAEALAAQKGKKFSGRGGVVELSLSEYVERHDPVKKAERALTKKLKVRVQEEESEVMSINQVAPGGESKLFSKLCINRVFHSARVRLTADQKHGVFARDHGQCTHINLHGERCTNDRYLHVHHIIPVSQGGDNDPNNLTTLCSSHHDLVHQLSFPIENQVTWLRCPTVEYLC